MTRGLHLVGQKELARLLALSIRVGAISCCPNSISGADLSHRRRSSRLQPPLHPHSAPGEADDIRYRSLEMKSGDHLCGSLVAMVVKMEGRPKGAARSISSMSQKHVVTCVLYFEAALES